MDTLEIYVRTSACTMNECPYGEKTLCVTCMRRMVAEHDAEIINKFAGKLKSRLGDALHTQDFESMRNLIDEVVKDQKE